MNRQVSSAHKGITRVDEALSIKCIECNKMFSQKVHMKSHVLSVHHGIKQQKRKRVNEAMEVYLNLKIETVES